VIRYFGSDEQQVEAVARRYLQGLRVEIAGYVPPTQLARRCRAAAINAYVMFPSLFHHKLLELLACGRPVLAFGAECSESIRLAAESGGNLIVVEDAGAVMRTIAQIHGAWKLPTPSQIEAERAPKCTWPVQVVALERVLAAAKRQ
jgi:glycosyltransferase involved in cell wall biosynthesis